MQEELGQRPEKRMENTQSVTWQINEVETLIGHASVGNVVKASQKADSVHSIENRQCYETEE